MSHNTDEERAWKKLEGKLETGDLKGLGQLDCTLTLLDSNDPLALDLVHSRLGPAIERVEDSGDLSHLEVVQLKKLKLAFKDKRDALEPE